MKAVRYTALVAIIAIAIVGAFAPPITASNTIICLLAVTGLSLDLLSERKLRNLLQRVAALESAHQPR